jgi:hypothetical protein
MKKKKLNLNKIKIAKLQNTKMSNISGGEATQTQNTCMPNCVDNNSIVYCETSTPCYNTIRQNCHYE